MSEPAAMRSSSSTATGPSFNAVMGGKAFMQAIPDIKLGGRLSKTEFQYTLQDASLSELFEWAPKVLAKLQTLPMLRDVASDQQIGGTTATLVIDRDRAAEFGIQPQAIDDTLYDAFGQRQVTQYFTQVNSYHLILEAPPEQLGKLDTLNSLYVHSTTGQSVPLSAFTKWSTLPSPAAVDQSPEPVPGHNLVVQPGARCGAG